MMIETISTLDISKNKHSSLSPASNIPLWFHIAYQNTAGPYWMINHDQMFLHKQILWEERIYIWGLLDLRRFITGTKLLNRSTLSKCAKNGYFRYPFWLIPMESFKLFARYRLKQITLTKDIKREKFILMV